MHDPIVIKSDEENLGRPRSGKWFVLGAILALVTAWGTLFLLFSTWKTRHKELAAYGANEVAPLVDALIDRVPPSTNAKTWIAAVEATHGMLEAATGSGTINRAELELLRDQIRNKVAKSTPKSAIKDLSELWDEMQAKVGPILMGKSSRPPFCPPRPKLLIPPEQQTN